MDPKQELFGLLEGVLKTEPEEDDLICKETFKNEHGLVIGGIANIFDSQIEQFGNDGIKLEKIDCEVPKIESEGTSEVKAADMFININDIIKQEISETATNLISLNDESTSKKRSEFPTTIKNELENFSDNKVIDIGGDIKQEVDGYQKLKTESELLTSHCDLPTLKDESEDYPDYYNLPCSSKQAESRSNLPLPENAAKIVSKKKKKLYPCPVCQKNFPSSKSRSKHINRHFGKRFVVCQFCGKLMTKTSFFWHYFLHIVKNSTSKFSQEKNLIVFYADGGSFKCDICFKKFNRKSGLQNHLKVHKGEKCDICSKRFTRNYHLQQHLVIHTNKKPLKCDICSKNFTTNYNLQRHLKKHTNKKAFKCDICFKEFSRNYTLNRHLITHTSEKSFKCDICSQDFSRKFNLQRHLIIHTNEKPFKCKICSKGFNDKSSSQKHLLIHTNEKAFKCDVCLKKFKLKSDLQRHLLIHSSKCNFCFKVFKYKTNLQKHSCSQKNKVASKNSH